MAAAGECKQYLNLFQLKNDISPAQWTCPATAFVTLITSYENAGARLHTTRCDSGDLTCSTAINNTGQEYRHYSRWNGRHRSIYSDRFADICALRRQGPFSKSVLHLQTYSSVPVAVKLLQRAFLQVMGSWSRFLFTTILCAHCFQLQLSIEFQVRTKSQDSFCAMFVHSLNCDLRKMGMGIVLHSCVAPLSC